MPTQYLLHIRRNIRKFLTSMNNNSVFTNTEHYRYGVSHIYAFAVPLTGIPARHAFHHVNGYAVESIVKFLNNLNIGKTS